MIRKIIQVFALAGRYIIMSQTQPVEVVDMQTAINRIASGQWATRKVA